MVAPGRKAATNKPSALIVEDDVVLYKILQTKFEKEGFEVRTAADGEEAIQTLRTYRPSIILLDIILPKKDGFEVLKETKADAAIADIPVIILTNLSQAEDRRHAAELGASDFLVKAETPIDEVVRRVKEKSSHYLSKRP